MTGQPTPRNVASLEQHLLEARASRGDDARGRNLQLLFLLERALEHGWFSYLPSREPARWLVTLLDLVGEHAGISMADRLKLNGRGLVTLLEGARLPLLAVLTLRVLSDALVVSPALRTLRLGPALTRGLVERMNLSALLAQLGFLPRDAVRDRNLGSSSVGQQIRRQVSAQLDPVWATALTAIQAPGFCEVLAALPPGFSLVEHLVRVALEHEGERLGEQPFAVFYALVTNASLGLGRRWAAPDWCVEGRAFTRSDFDATHRDAVRWARLAISGSCPLAVTVIDGWLERQTLPELVCDADWYRHREANAEVIEAIERELLGLVSAASAGLRSKSAKAKA